MAHETDVVIVGTGAAGAAAAIAALEAGAEVTLLEAADTPGGTTRLSGGAFWIPNNSWLRSAGATDPRDHALRLMARLAHPALYDPSAPQAARSARPSCSAGSPAATPPPIGRIDPQLMSGPVGLPVLPI